MSPQMTASQNDSANGTVSAAELAEIVAVAREFAERELQPHALELDLRDEHALATAWRGVCEIGLDRALLAADAGGVGLSPGGFLCVLEELAVGEAGVAMLVLLANAALWSLPAEALAGARGEARFAALLLPESGAPGGGGLTLDGDVLNGRLGFALGAAGAEGLLIAGLGAAGDEARFVVATAGELAIESVDAQLGLRAAHAASLACSGVASLPAGGAQATLDTSILLHAGSAAIARGVMRRAYAVALDYAENRPQGGVMIVEHGAVRDLLARISERAEIGAGFGGIALAEPGTPAGDAALARAIKLKTAVTDAATEATIDAVQVFGGMGYMHETGVEKLMRDAKYCQLFPRANWLARDQLVELERG